MSMLSNNYNKRHSFVFNPNQEMSFKREYNEECKKINDFFVPSLEILKGKILKGQK